PEGKAALDLSQGDDRFAYDLGAFERDQDLQKRHGSGSIVLGKLPDHVLADTVPGVQEQVHETYQPTLPILQAIADEAVDRAGAVTGHHGKRGRGDVNTVVLQGVEE